MRERSGFMNSSAYLLQGKLRISPVGRVLHNVFAVAVPDMNPDYAVPLKVFLVDGFDSGRNFRPGFDILKDLSFGIFAATPHQASVTHYSVGFGITFAFKKFSQLVAFPEDLLIRAVNAVNRRLIPPRREERSRKCEPVNLIVANDRYARDVLNWLEEHRKGVREWFVEITRATPIYD
ncbi:hypothetical protein ILFOPFJJ_06740 [Ensifer psoraleae]|nr:hypothetical protein [Sinorhizobium psoraleae]